MTEYYFKTDVIVTGGAVRTVMIEAATAKEAHTAAWEGCWNEMIDIDIEASDKLDNCSVEDITRLDCKPAPAPPCDALQWLRVNAGALGLLVAKAAQDATRCGCQKDADRWLDIAEELKGLLK